MIKRIKRHTISFKNAFAGIVWAFKTQPNYQIHFGLSGISLIASFALHISYTEFIIIIILIFLGLAFETVNTAFEAASDAIDTTWRQDIKVVKDLAAGAMLLYAIGSAIAAGMIFIPRIVLLLR